MLAITATPFQFRQMTLVPYVVCLESFTQLMRDNPLLAEHVRVIVYDAQHRYTPDFVPDSLMASGEAVKKRMRDNCFWFMDDDGSPEAMLVTGVLRTMETTLLVGCLRTLPMLTDLRVTEFVMPSTMLLSVLPLDKLPSYFRRMCNGTDIESFSRTQSRVSEPYPAAKLAFLAADLANIKPTKIVATDIDHEFFLASGEGRGRLEQMNQYKNLFGNLVTLTMKFQGFGDNQPSETRTFGSLVKGAKNVAELSLWLPDASVTTWTGVPSSNHG